MPAQTSAVASLGKTQGRAELGEFAEPETGEGRGQWFKSEQSNRAQRKARSWMWQDMRLFPWQNRRWSKWGDGEERSCSLRLLNDRCLFSTSGRAVTCSVQQHSELLQLHQTFLLNFSRCSSLPVRCVLKLISILHFHQQTRTEEYSCREQSKMEFSGSRHLKSCLPFCPGKISSSSGYNNISYWRFYCFPLS